MNLISPNNLHHSHPPPDIVVLRDSLQVPCSKLMAKSAKIQRIIYEPHCSCYCVHILLTIILMGRGFEPHRRHCVVVLEQKVSDGAKIRNRYNQVPHLTQDTNGKVTNSQKTPQTRAKRSALSQQVTTKHI